MTQCHQYLIFPIVTKAIWDGSIDASVDHSKGWMQSKEIGDIFNIGCEPLEKLGWMGNHFLGVAILNHL
jgi:hypothetical protein